MTISQTHVRARRAPGKPGQAYDLSGEEIDFTNEDPQAAQVSTVTVGGTPTKGTEYAFSVNGVEVKHTAGASPTTATVAAALADAVNADPAIRASVKASASAAVVTLTGLVPGVEFTLTESDANLTIATTTTAAEADAIPFGRLCVRAGASGVEPYPNRLGRLPQSGDSIDDDALGVALFTYDEEGNEYPANSRVAAMKEGRVWVEVDTAVSEDDDVYVGTAAGEEGKFYNTTGTGRLKLKKSVCRFFKSRADDGLAVVECNFY